MKIARSPLTLPVGGLMVAALLAACASAGPSSAEARAETDAPAEPTLEVVAATTPLAGPEGATGTLRLPTVRGPDATAADRANAELDAARLIGESVDDIVAEFARCGCGVVSADFEVALNTPRVLSLDVVVETIAAYPSGYSIPIVLDAHRGARLTARDVFEPVRQGDLVTRVRSALASRIAERARAARSDGEEWAAEALELEEFGFEGLERFLITADGVIFEHAWSLPHAARAYQPDGRVAVPWREVAPALTAPWAALAR